jgi:hypothetical protein
VDSSAKDDDPDESDDKGKGDEDDDDDDEDEPLTACDKCAKAGKPCVGKAASACTRCAKLKAKCSRAVGRGGKAREGESPCFRA